MRDIHRVGDLELKQDLLYQQHTWGFERMGWITMVLIAIAALLGLTGSGWLSRATQGQSDDPIWLEYERFGRYHAPDQLRIHVNKSFPNNQLQVGISRHYLEGVQIQQITPEPDQVELGNDYLTYSFNGTAPTAVTFYTEPEHIGFLDGSVALDGEQSLQFRQFIYP